MKSVVSGLGFFVFLVACSGILSAQETSVEQKKQTAQKKPAKLEKMKLGGFKNLSKVGNLYLSGQFQPIDIDHLKKMKVKKVISLRTVQELKWGRTRTRQKGRNEVPAVTFSPNEPTHR